MGQVINVEHERVADTVVFSADRSITGQQGHAFKPDEAISENTGFGGALAARLFESDDAIDHVWIASNTVVVRRKEDWQDSDVEEAAAVVSDFFVFYRNA